MVHINDDWCKGCNLCIINCPRVALQVSRRFNRRGIHPPELMDDHTCNSCRLCELVCPDFAITVDAEMLVVVK